MGKPRIGAVILAAGKGTVTVSSSLTRELRDEMLCFFKRGHALFKLGDYANAAAALANRLNRLLLSWLVHLRLAFNRLEPALTPSGQR